MFLWYNTAADPLLMLTWTSIILNKNVKILVVYILLYRLIVLIVGNYLLLFSRNLTNGFVILIVKEILII